MHGETKAFQTVIGTAAVAVNQGLNVILTGHPGAGQATVAQLLCEEFSLDRKPVRINGTRAWRGIRFAALYGLGTVEPAVQAGETRPNPAQLARFVDRLVATTGASGVIVVENPRWLDSGTTGVIAETSRRSRIPVVVVSRSQSTNRIDVALLRDLQPGLRLEIPPLGLDDIHALVHEILDGPVETEAVARIAAMSAGLHEMVVGITTVGVHTGALVRHGDRWRAVGELVTGDLAGWVEHVLGDISEPQRNVLRRLAADAALGEPFTPLPSDADDLGALMDIGLINEQRGALTLFPPLLADYARVQPQVIFRDAVTLAAASPDKLELPRVLAAIPHPADSDMELSRRIHRKGLADVAAARRSWLTSRRAAAALPLLVALQATGAEPEQIEEVVSEVVPEPEETDYLSVRFWWAVYVALTLGRVDEGLDILAHAPANTDRGRALVRTAQDYLKLTSGTDARAAAPDTEAIRDKDYASLVHAIAIERCVIQGLTQQALDRADDAPAAVRPVFVIPVPVSTNLALIVDGRVDEGLEYASRELARAEAAMDLGRIYAHGYVTMAGLIMAGRLQDAHRLLARVLVVGTAKALHGAYQAGTLDFGVVVHVLRGDPAGARAMATAVTAIDGKRGAFPGMWGLNAQTLKDPSGAADRLWRVAQSAAKTEQLVLAVFAAVSSLTVRHDAASARLVQQWAARTESPLLELLGKYAVALSRQSAEKLLELAGEFFAMGIGLYGARSLIQAALACYEHGDAERGFEIGRTAWADTAFMGPDRTGLFAELNAHIGLSEREAEAAQIGLTMASSREIANQMHLSPRTVENYLYSAYVKTGTHSRDELSAACASWLRPAVA